MLHYQASGAVPIPTFDLANRIGDGWEATMAKQVSQECVLVGVQCSYLDGSGLDYVAAGHEGDVAGQMLPPNNAFLLRHSVTGSSRGGRTFLPGVPAGAVFNNGEVDAPYTSGLETEWFNLNSFILANVDEAPVQVILTKTGTKTVQSTSVGPVIVSQRRRMD